MFKQYIGGNLVEGKGKVMEVINPATEEIIERFNNSTAAQAQEALEAAREAFEPWSQLSLSQRGEWIERLKSAILSQKEKLLDLLMNETGKPYSNATNDFNHLVGCLTYFYEEAKRLYGAILPDYNNDFRHFVIMQPLGVVVGHLAWNFPLLNVGFKLGPTLASGCTCVLKPASKTPLASLFVGEIADSIDFPKGVINIVTGPSNEVARTLNESKIPRMIALIGSSEAGRTLIGQTSTSIKRLALELGGNTPAIVMADADLAKAASLLAGLRFFNTGQVCVSPNRVYVHESIHKEFVSLVLEQAQGIRLGWGRQAGAVMGPLISKEDRQRILDLIEDAQEKGANLVYGGCTPKDKTRGFYVLPTILDNVTHEMRCVGEETFGPILGIQAFGSTEEVIEKANRTEYGLAAHLFTNDMKQAFHIAERLEAGTVCINEPVFTYSLPHGGVKESGIGKDCSRYGLEEFYYIKRISVRL